MSDHFLISVEKIRASLSNARKERWSPVTLQPETPQKDIVELAQSTTQNQKKIIEPSTPAEEIVEVTLSPATTYERMESLRDLLLEFVDIYPERLDIFLEDFFKLVNEDSTNLKPVNVMRELGSLYRLPFGLDRIIVLQKLARRNLVKSYQFINLMREIDAVLTDQLVHKDAKADSHIEGLGLPAAGNSEETVSELFDGLADAS